MLEKFVCILKILDLRSVSYQCGGSSKYCSIKNANLSLQALDFAFVISNLIPDGSSVAVARLNLGQFFFQPLNLSSVFSYSGGNGTNRIQSFSKFSVDFRSKLNHTISQGFIYISNSSIIFKDVVDSIINQSQGSVYFLLGLFQYFDAAIQIRYILQKSNNAIRVFLVGFFQLDVLSSAIVFTFVNCIFQCGLQIGEICAHIRIQISNLALQFCIDIGNVVVTRREEHSHGAYH